MHHNHTGIYVFVLAAVFYGNCLHNIGHVGDLDVSRLESKMDNELYNLRRDAISRREVEMIVNNIRCECR